jgi:non-specific serine/threonine protein kinase
VVRAARTFVGRSADLAALTQTLDPTARSGTRLLTLTGVAGSGKSRLALAVAEGLRDTYPGGVWLAELAPLPASPAADLAPVAGAVLAALKLYEQPGQDPLDTLAAHLKPRRLLLVLDNCEQVVAAAAALTAQLLGACPQLRVLATSQVPLGIVDERVWKVSALAVPPPLAGESTPADLHRLRQCDAVQLFVDRAQAVQPGFVPGAQNAAPVVTICRQLDGLPLAIELAVARLNVLPVEDVLTRLADRFRLLRQGGRTAADRHQTLQATLDWSYDLLAPAEQTVLRRLAVFAGGWELAAAEMVCAGDEIEVDATMVLLDELLERSLVYVYDAGGVPRYGMLETVRQYGLQQLERVGETEQARNWHLSWCVMLAAHAAPALLGPEQAAWLARLDREHDNARAALQWALDRDLSARALELAVGLWQFWRTHRGHLSEGRRWLAAVLALPADEDDPTAMALRASALEGAAWLAEDEHDFAQASALFAESSALRHALGQHGRTTSLLINEAMEARARGDYAHATRLLEETLAIHRALGNRETITRGGLGLSLSRLALLLAEQGEYTRATALYEECVSLHRELGDREGMAYALLGLGDIARDQGNTQRVYAYCEVSLAIFRELGHTLVGFALNNLALAAYLHADLSLAAQRAAESEAFFRQLPAEPNLAEVLVTMGRIRGALGDAPAARASLTEALRLAWAKGPRWIVAAALEERLCRRYSRARHSTEPICWLERRFCAGSWVRQSGQPTSLPSMARWQRRAPL